MAIGDRIAATATPPAAPAPSGPQPSGPGPGPGPDAAPAAPRPPAGAPVLRQHRDSLLPAVAAALSARDGTRTHPGHRDDAPPALHPLVAAFLAGLPPESRERFTGRCAEAILLSQYLATAEANRSRRASRKPLGLSDARKALKGARMTTVRIREEGDPAHGTHQPPCRSCAPMLEHFGVRSVAVAPAAAG
ncbi:deaminase [Streptacidiphilus sp. ASG 303]|uniref:YwqJ-related putative deaminase n=1 Tax=Streptacidiphilus sp. ASG 303 TaxID=2896847 RepID=UPI001E614DC5|nr:YwqJ-related putative deaminase [Streptacidiphilus sp. ASG 303]MCD0483913.1 deaminase [Streptacidiphilus sp. ASG 303]